MARIALLGTSLLFVACKPSVAPDTTETYAGPFERVEAHGRNGRIEVAPHDSDDVDLEFLASTSDTWTAVDEDGVLVLTAVCFGEEEPGCSGGFVLGVPADQELLLSTEEGEISLVGDLNGKVDLTTTSGAIGVDDGGALDATALTGTGEVRVSFATAPAALSFDSGASLLSVAVPAGRYALDVEAGGNVAIAPEIEDGAGPPIRLHSGAGSVDLFATE